MKRTALGAGLFAFAAVFAAGNVNQVSAEALTASTLRNPTGSQVQLAVLNHVEQQVIKSQEPAPQPVAEQPRQHKVADGETLTSIAKQHETTWQRLYAKNTSVQNPDVIEAGADLTIPAADEQLAERPLPIAAPETEPVSVAPVKKVAPKKQTMGPNKKASSHPKAVVYRGSVAGNTYTPGQCTWHVKNLRGSSLPNGLGDANQWYGRAKAMGLSTGTTPVVGAAGVRKYGNHAVYVTAVHPNGTITVSEMNYNYTPYATRTAIKKAADFYYIY